MCPNRSVTIALLGVPACLALVCLAAPAFSQERKPEPGLSPVQATAEARRELTRLRRKPEPGLPPVQVFLPAREYLSVFSMASSPDNTTLALGVGGRNPSVVLFDVPTGKVRQILSGHSNVVTALWFSPDGAELLAAHTPLGPERQSAVKRWDVIQGLETGLFPLVGGGANRAFSHDGKRLVTVTGHPNPVAKLWDIASARQLAALDGGKDLVDVKCAAFSPDSKTLAVGGGRGGEFTPGEVVLWDCDTFKELRRFKSDGGYARKVRFSPRGDYLACAFSLEWDQVAFRGGLYFFDLKTGAARPFRYKRHVEDFDLSPDGRTVAVVAGSLGVYLLDVATGRTVRRLEKAQGGIHRVMFFPDGCAIVGISSQGEILLWRLPGEKAPE